MANDRLEIQPAQAAILLLSVLIISVCGLVYELIIGTLSSYLLGSSVTHFSLTIGSFLFAMGIGSLLSRFVLNHVLQVFILVEIVTGICGGISAALLMGVFTFTDHFYLAMFAMILLIGGCMGLEIPLLTRIVSGKGELKDHLAHIFSVDYLGALVGSIAFPLLLLPTLGLIGTAFATGVLNLLVAGVVLYAFRSQVQSRLFALVIGCAVLALLAGLIKGSLLGDFMERQLYADRIVYSEQTPYQKIVLTQYKHDLRMFLDGALQFSTADEYRYHEALVHPAMTLAASRSSVLVLGGGDGLGLREILKYPDVERVTVIDIDPAVTELASGHLLLRQANADALRDRRVQIVHQDAFTAVGESAAVYDVILCDLPDPRTEALGKLYSGTFYRILKRRLSPGGTLAVQSTSPFFARQAFWSIVTTIRGQGLQALPYHVHVPSFGDWGFVLAAHAPIQPSRYQPSVPLRFFDAKTFGASQVFSADIAEVAADASTLNRPSVLTYYQAAWKHWR